MNIDLVKIMPHKEPMLLIDKILSHNSEKLKAGVTITEKSLGFENGFVPSWFGVEYMAQTIAAFNGLNYSDGGDPEIGFLVGVRNYKAVSDKFVLGSELEISITPDFIIDNSGSFTCKIEERGQLIAEALLTTYKPDQEFIKKLRNENGE